MRPKARMLLFALLVSILLAVLAACASTPAETHFVILATSDMHGNVWGYSYEDDQESDNDGMARLLTYIEQVRAENETVFLVDAGDDIQGTIMCDDIANKRPDEPHPVMEAMNLMGYDAMTVGNHEFNWGIDTMQRILSQAEFPVLGANVRDAAGDYVTGAGWTIVERGGVKLAIIGVCTPDVVRWDTNKEGIADTTFEPAYSSVTQALEEIGDAADVVLVSGHLARYPEFDEEGGSDSGYKILDENPKIDILQLAHAHETVDETRNGTPIVGVRKSGREIARIDVTLDADGHVTDVATQIVDMEGVKPAEELRALPAVRQAHEEALGLIRAGTDGNGGEPLGTTTARFQPENEISGLPEGKLRDTAVLDLILYVELLNSNADVASATLFKDTSDLPEGDIYYKNIFDIYKYDNTLYTVEVSGKELKDYMEWSAACYNQWKPGDINVSFNPELPGYLLDMFAGVDYEINLAKPVGERIENVMMDGEPLADDARLTLATNNYRYTAGLKADGLVEGTYSWESSCSIRDMLVAYFAEHSPVEPTVNDNWRITGIDLSSDDPRRAEIVGYINEGLLATPYNESYNLADYDALAAEAKANKEAGVTVGAVEGTEVKK